MYKKDLRLKQHKQTCDTYRKDALNKQQLQFGFDFSFCIDDYN